MHSQLWLHSQLWAHWLEFDVWPICSTIDTDLYWYWFSDVKCNIIGKLTSWSNFVGTPSSSGKNRFKCKHNTDGGSMIDSSLVCMLVSAYIRHIFHRAIVHFPNNSIVHRINYLHFEHQIFETIVRSRYMVARQKVNPCFNWQLKHSTDRTSFGGIVPFSIFYFQRIHEVVVQRYDSFGLRFFNNIFRTDERAKKDREIFKEFVNSPQGALEWQRSAFSLGW